MNYRYWPILSLIVAGMVCSGCSLSPMGQLKKRAEKYYEALMYNDYDTLYNFLSAEMKSQLSRNDYVRFMESVDTMADFDEFKIDSVVVHDNIGKVRLQFKGGYWIFRGKKNVTSTWIRQEGKWYMQKDARGEFWNRFIEWMAEQRMRRLPLLSRPLNRIAAQIERYREKYGSYPVDLSALGKDKDLIDPNSEGKPFRYYSDGATFWFLAANGPDGKADIDVTLFRGDIGDYPNMELIFDP